MTVYTFEPSKHTEGIGHAGESVIGCASAHAGLSNDNDNDIFSIAIVGSCPTN